MPGGGGGDRTEQATPKRKQDERKKGNVFQSQEIGKLVGLLAVFYMLQFMASYLLSAIFALFEHFWTEASHVTAFTAANVRRIFIQCALAYGVAAVPVLLVAGLVAIVATIAQTRGLFSSAKIKPKFSNLNPVNGIKKVFSVRGLVELLKSILKIIILGYVVYNSYTERFGQLPRLMEMEFPLVLQYAAAFVMDMVTSVSMIFAFLTAADFMYQRWQHEKDLRMSKQEIKEEYKQTEGDPQVKGQRRQMQRQMAQGRMMEAVPEADVVIRNPTHYAVAVRYEAGKNTSPQVVAKGADYLALRIIKLAEENGVTCVENRPLARGLYENVPLEREIPEEFFQPVAEVLAFVYSTAKNKKHKNPSAKADQ